jgi:adenylosuccinate synthase
MKAYSTRVGGGPFPTEQDNDIGNYIRERGNEYGTTTRRPRRCGWLDAMAVKYSVALNGITAVAMTLIDVLSGLDHVKICTAYKHHGARLDTFAPTWTHSPKSNRFTKRFRAGAATSPAAAASKNSPRKPSSTSSASRY